MSMFKGLFTALITPFQEDGGLDVSGLRFLIRRQIEAKVEGIVLFGSTGEAQTLSMEEKEKILRIAVEEAKDKTLLIAGTGSSSTEQTIKNTLSAKERGADGALIVTPFYNKPTQEGIYRHFKAVAEQCHFPILVYNSPGRSATHIEVNTLQRLAQLEFIVGIKEASALLPYMMDVLLQVGKENPAFSILSGDDIFAFPLMALGGHGVISVASNLFPAPMKEFIDSLKGGDFQKGQRVHFELLPLLKLLFLETNPIPVKAAMHFLGLPAGECRLPLCPLSSVHAKMLRDFLTHFSLGQTALTLLSAREGERGLANG